MVSSVAGLVVRLDDGALPIEEVGGKAVNLAKMTASGFRVPPAFALTVKAYDVFMDRTGLRGRIAEVLKGIDYESGDSVKAASERICGMVAAEKLSDSIIPDLEVQIDAIGGGDHFAVRSSAVAEDLADASFAGQQDTFLDVRRADVGAMAVRCWASYWNDRAMKYRHDASVDHLSQGMAVVVQRMVCSDISGVMFTVNPVDGGQDIVVEASWGLGESIVSGTVTPDRYTIGRDGTVKDVQVRQKDKGYFMSDRGSELRSIPEEKVGVRCADDDTLRALSKIGLDLEKHFGAPQDIEWAVEKGVPYILQSRAVTTLTDESEKDGLLWSRAYGDEYWADATTPLFYDVMGKMLTEYVNHEGARVMGYKDLVSGPLIKLHKSRVYFNTDVLERVFAYYPKFIRSKELLNYFPLKYQGRILDHPNDYYHTVMSQLLVAVRDPDGMMWRTDKAYKAWAKAYMERCAVFDATDLRTLSDGDLRKLYLEMEEASKKHYRLIRYGMVSHSIATNLMVKNWLASWVGDDGTLYAGLISGLPDNKTVATNVGFSEMGRIIREDPEIKHKADTMSAADFLSWMESTDNPLKVEFASFMKEYGHRSSTREIMAPRWKEDPEYVIGVAIQMAGTDIDLKAKQIACQESRERTEKEAIARLRATNGGRVKALIFRKVLAIAQTYLTFRENQRFYLDHIMFRNRLMFLEVGRRLAERHSIDAPDDVFFLYEGEAWDALAGKDDVCRAKHIADRRREYCRYESVLPPKFLKDGIDFDDTVVTEGQSTIYGAASSPGSYTGKVRVISDVRALSQVQPGEILVTSNTDPGWTVVFSKLGGLITETGGILSHGAVISREYRIPAVTAVKSATTLLRTGQTVTVDGNGGLVRIVEGHE